MHSVGNGINTNVKHVTNMHINIRYRTLHTRDITRIIALKYTVTCNRSYQRKVVHRCISR